MNESLRMQKVLTAGLQAAEQMKAKYATSMHFLLGALTLSGEERVVALDELQKRKAELEVAYEKIVIRSGEGPPFCTGWNSLMRERIKEESSVESLLIVLLSDTVEAPRLLKIAGIDLAVLLEKLKQPRKSQSRMERALEAGLEHSVKVGNLYATSWDFLQGLFTLTGEDRVKGLEGLNHLKSVQKIPGLASSIRKPLGVWSGIMEELIKISNTPEELLEKILRDNNADTYRYLEKSGINMTEFIDKLQSTDSKQETESTVQENSPWKKTLLLLSETFAKLAVIWEQESS